MIALFIALTGVGAGTVTVPVLILVLGLPAPTAVGIGLMFATTIKSVLVPSQILRRNVVWRTLGYMLLGGLPGVVAGTLFLQHIVHAGSQNLVNALLGVILVTTASGRLLYSLRPASEDAPHADHSPLLSWLMLPVGAEVGFSSAGAGALGSAALLSLTPLLPAQIVGTDIAFGFVLSLIGGSAHWFSPALNTTLLLRLIIGGIPGAICGVILSPHIPRRPLRFALWLWILVLGGEFLLKSYQFWAGPQLR